MEVKPSEAQKEQARKLVNSMFTPLQKGEGTNLEMHLDLKRLEESIAQVLADESERGWNEGFHAAEKASKFLKDILPLP